MTARTRPVCFVALLMAAATLLPAAEPELGGGRWLMSFSWYPSYEVSSPTGGMALSPDGRWLLYARRQVETRDDGGERELWCPMLLKTADRLKLELPVEPLGSESLLKRWLNMRVFSPDGSLLALPVCTAGRCTTGLWDLGSGQLRRIGPSGAVVLPGFAGDGSLVVTTGDDSQPPRVVIMDLDGSGLRPLRPPGVAGPACPVAPVLPLVAVDGAADAELTGALVLVDTAGGPSVTVAEAGEPVGRMHWTRNGRFLYWSVVRPGTGERRTLVWDRSRSRRVAEIDGAVPAGSGPGQSSMVLAAERSEGQSIVLHDAVRSDRWSVGHAFPNLVTAESGRVLYVDRLDEDEFDIVLAEIAR